MKNYNVMKPVIILFAALFSCGALAFDIAELEVMSGTEKQVFFESFIDGIYDHDQYSNQDVNEIVAFAINENNNEYLGNVLLALSYEAIYISASYDRRVIQNVPDFKEVVINRINEGLENDSWIEEKTIPYWWFGYIPLSVNYKEDEDVENLILKSINLLPGMIGDFLGFLNFGNFRSEATQEIRYDNVLNPDANLAQKAIDGIGQTLPAGGIEVLADAVEVRKDASLVNIFNAFAAYGSRSKEYLPVLERVLLEIKTNQYEWMNIPNNMNVMESSIESIKNAE